MDGFELVRLSRFRGFDWRNLYDIKTNVFTYASGGHPPLLVHRRSSGEIIQLKPQATFLGIFDPVEFVSDTFELQQGDRVIFYTDGLFETSDGQDEQFGMERVLGLIESHSKKEIQPLLDTLLSELKTFIGAVDPDDDITLVGLDIL